jgi:hypothetical protein
MADAANTAAVRNGGGYARHHLVQIVAAAAARCRVDLGVGPKRIEVERVGRERAR